MVTLASSRGQAHQRRIMAAEPPNLTSCRRDRQSREAQGGIAAGLKESLPVQRSWRSGLGAAPGRERGRLWQWRP